VAWEFNHAFALKLAEHNVARHSDAEKQKMTKKQDGQNQMKCEQSKLIIFSGMLWLGVGIFLLNLGLTLLSTEPLFLIPLALIIGVAKGRFVLRKSALRVMDRIRSLPNPAPIAQAYSLGYIILIASMIGIGVLIKVFQCPNDIRGFVDTAVGAGLIQGSLHYFRGAKTEVKCSM
jgi:F0F1-type ATP synthase assembly protein I